jgi:hypothetical protein
LLRLCAAAFALATLVACAQLHHVQLGDIDGTKGRLRPFDVKVSETGISLDEARAVANVLASNADKGNIGQIGEYLSYFQMGPHTGNGVFTDKYAEGVLDMLYKRCPSGRITGLTAVRESKKYPVISGEIVRITGYCIEGGGSGRKKGSKR